LLRWVVEVVLEFPMVGGVCVLWFCVVTCVFAVAMASFVAMEVSVM
jgi:hypothetical protein